ncbi:3-thiaglutamate biosynthesis pearlin carrier peptide TglA [Actinokineospora sp.]
MSQESARVDTVEPAAPAAPEPDSGIEEFDLDDIEVIESKVFG